MFLSTEANVKINSSNHGSSCAMFNIRYDHHMNQLLEVAQPQVIKWGKLHTTSSESITRQLVLCGFPHSMTWGFATSGSCFMCHVSCSMIIYTWPERTMTDAQMVTTSMRQNGLLMNFSLPIHPWYLDLHPADHVLTINSRLNQITMIISRENKISAALSASSYSGIVEKIDNPRQRNTRKNTKIW